MHVATFKSITLAWSLAQTAAFATSLVFQPKGHYPSMDIALVALGVGMAAIAGFGIGVVAYVALQVIARINFGFQKREVLYPWQLTIMACTSIIGGTFVLSALNAVFQEGNAFLFALMAVLSSIAFTRSVASVPPQ